MKRNILISAVIMVVFQYISISAANNKAGTSTAQFLKIGMGARPAAMGEAFTGIAGDASAVYWNPAGLGKIIRKQGTFSHISWLDEITYNHATYIHPIAQKGTVAFSVNYVSYGDIPKTVVTEYGSYLRDDGSFTASDACYAISFGNQQRNGRLYHGFTVKYLAMEIDGYQATSFAGDLGAIMSTPIENLTWGFSILNIGTEMKFIEESESLPMLMRCGAGYTALEAKNLTISVDVHKPFDSQFSGHAGLEYVVGALFAIRCGFKSDNVSDIEGLTGITAGLGFMISDIAQLDYAFVPYGDLGTTHRIGISFNFGDPVDDEREDKGYDEDNSFTMEDWKF